MSVPLPFISVLLCSKDRHESLERALAHLKKVLYPSDRYEIVIVEEDGPRAEPIEGVRYVPIPRKNLGVGYARNVALDAVDPSRSDIVAFCDDDEITDADWLTEIARAFSDPEVKGMAGLVRIQPGSAWSETQEILGLPGGGLKRLAQESHEAIVPTTLLSTANCAYRTSVAKEFRFPEDLVGKAQGEDYVFNSQVAARHSLVFNPKAIVYHEPRTAPLQLVRSYIDRQKRGYLGQIHLLGRSPLMALISKGHQLVLLRVAAVAALIALFSWKIGGVLALAYYFGTLFSVREVYGFVRLKTSFFLYPFAKALADVGVFVGEISCLGGLLPRRMLSGLFSFVAAAPPRIATPTFWWSLARRAAAAMEATRHGKPLLREFPELRSFPDCAADFRRELAPIHARYTATVSTWGMAVSLELATLLRLACHSLRPGRILDLGSGFSSLVIRAYAVERARSGAPPPLVVSVDLDPDWLKKTAAFLASENLSNHGLLTWQEFTGSDIKAFDLVLIDLGLIEERARLLPELLDCVLPGGWGILDDMHNPAYNRRSKRLLRERGWPAFSLRRYTCDRIGRYSFLTHCPPTQAQRVMTPPNSSSPRGNRPA